MSYDKIPTQIDTSLKQMSWIVHRIALDWGKLVTETFREIEEQPVIEDDYIYNEVKDQVERIIVKKEKPDEAHIKLFGVIIKKRILHRKSERYNGADLLLQIEDRKFALVQFKRVNSDHRYRFDQGQLDKLSAFCQFCDETIIIPPQCPSYILLIDDTPRYPVYRVYRLCEVRRILNGRGSVHKTEFYQYGVQRRTFKESFVKCWAGAYMNIKPNDEELLDYTDETQRLIVDYHFAREK